MKPTSAYEDLMYAYIMSLLVQGNKLLEKTNVRLGCWAKLKSAIARTKQKQNL